MASLRRQTLLALGGEREVDHHDRVLLHDAHEQDDADQRHDGEIVAADHQGEERADAGRGQGRENGQRVDEALVEDAQHDVDRDHGREHEPRLAGQRLIELGRLAREAADQGRGSPTSSSARPMARSAAPSDPPCARSKLSVAAGN